MGNLLKDEAISNQHIMEIRNEIERMYRIHNWVRSIIDMVKNDAVLSTFYDYSKQKYIGELEDESEIFLLRKTLETLSEYIGSSTDNNLIIK